MMGWLKVRGTTESGKKYHFVGREQRDGSWIVYRVSRFGRKHRLSTWGNGSDAAGEMATLVRRARGI